MNRLYFAFASPLVLGLALGGCNSPDVMEQERNADAPQSNVTTVTSTNAQTGANSSTSTSSTDGTGTSISTSTQTGSGNSASASSSTSTSNGALSTSEETSDYEFSYSWPAEAGREPGLAKLLQADLEDARHDVRKYSAQARAEFGTSPIKFRQHSLDVNWQVVADLPQMLSMSSNMANYSGGAHGNLGFDTLVWDKKNAKRLAASDFFASPAAMWAALKPRFCAALNKERATKRREAIDPESNGQFDKCPPMDELDILLGSSNGRTFDRIGLLAAPYVAGPYAEGDYEVTLKVDGTMMSAVKPAYKQFFSVSK